jgi:RNA-directed DNA polymerase
MFSRNKKELHKVRIFISDFLKPQGLELKNNWQLFKVDSRPLDFLGYRFYRGYTTLRRSNFLRIKRRVKKIVKRGYLRLTDAYSIISYNGWLSHCNSFNYRNKYINPYNISLEKCKGVVRNGRSKLKL